MKTKIGQTIEAFMKWKAMPGRKDQQKYKRANKFREGLNIFINKQMKGAFNPFKN